MYKRFLEAPCLFREAFHDGLRWSISAAQTKIDWVSAVLMHFSPPDAGNFNRIPAMACLRGSPSPIFGRASHGCARPDFFQR
ncbi:hypothetical protein CO662_08520 [Rhizobium anhuiense]|uniref:Uncharacterized protein n=1 Tax=Rhizobium anhuiense TaxID=1184720 RepID=A0ABX4JEX3_9HYPH|nr:hypothetical protein CO668_11260 [Rhizobium anhuiense]PDS52563.1 hypothetical protein CO662_08520 [Rhizobium anhuiense]PDS58073.1 hypothetical protein CO663_14360 [Rhizobium anhuiense]